MIVRMDPQVMLREGRYADTPCNDPSTAPERFMDDLGRVPVTCLCGFRTMWVVPVEVGVAFPSCIKCDWGDIAALLGSGVSFETVAKRFGLQAASVRQKWKKETDRKCAA